MGFEIERRFLVKNTEFIKEATKKAIITQRYLHKDKDKTIRVRTKNIMDMNGSVLGKLGELTIKGGSPKNGIAKYEYNSEIAYADAKDLFKLCDPGTILKTRHLVPTNVSRLMFEVDLFHLDNDGLIIAEIELENEEDKFEKPSWLGEEITGIDKYQNAQLVVHPYKDWDKKEKRDRYVERAV